MGLIVKDGYLPGFTEAHRNSGLEAYLTQRGYCVDAGGAEIAHFFHLQIINEMIKLEIGAEGFDHLSEMKDLRNKIIASCAKHNCMSAIWWMVECEIEKKWTLYAGVWNETLGFMVLDDPHYHPVPLVWLTEQHQALRPLLDLATV